MEINNAFPDLDRNLYFFTLGVDEPIILSKKDIKFFNKFGFLFPIRIFNSIESKKIKKYFDDLLQKAIESGWNILTTSCL